MQFLKTLFWVLVAAVLTVFAFNNWDVVTINLWQDLQLQTFLPVLVIGAFVAGVLLIWLPHRASRWSWKRKMDSTERKLADERAERNRLEERLVVERDRVDTHVSRPAVARTASGERLVVEPGETVVVSPTRDADGRLISGHDERF